MNQITVDQVVSVYSGKANKCACGCSGTYRYASAYRDQGIQLRGYAIDADEVNDRQVAKVVGLLNANIQDVTVETHFAWVCLDGRGLCSLLPEPLSCLSQP